MSSKAVPPNLSKTSKSSASAAKSSASVSSSSSSLTPSSSASNSLLRKAGQSSSSSNGLANSSSNQNSQIGGQSGSGSAVSSPPAAGSSSGLQKSGVNSKSTAANSKSMAAGRSRIGGGGGGAGGGGAGGGGDEDRGANASAKKVGKKANEPRVVISTDRGELDLTPLRLVPVGSVGRGRGAGESRRSGNASPAESSAVFDPFSSRMSNDMSQLSRNDSFDALSDALSDNESDAGASDGAAKTLAAGGAVGGAGVAGGAGAEHRWSDGPQHSEPVKKKVWTDAELDEVVTLELRESETMTVLQLAGVCVWAEDATLHAHVSAKNTTYRRLVEERPAKDIYAHRAAQTFNGALKEKEVWAQPPPTRTTGMEVTVWDIFDTYEAQSAQEAQQQAARANKAAGTSTVSVGVGGDDDDELAAQQVVAVAVGGGGGRGNADPNASASSTGASRSHHNMSASSSSSASASSASSSASGGGGGGSVGTMSGGGSSVGVGVGSSSVGLGAAGVGANAASAAAAAGLPPIPKHLKGALDMLERAIVQNQIHEQHLLFRNHPAVHKAVALEDGDELGLDEAKSAASSGLRGALDADLHSIAIGTDEEIPADDIAAVRRHRQGGAPRLGRLWTFRCPHTDGRNVSGMDWNRFNPDLLATSYGDFSFGSRRDGVVCLWTLKNPSFPERLIRCRASVTSIDFCTEHPQLLAAGMYDGSVAIYDIREGGDKPALESAYATGKHSESVMDLKWLTKGNEHVSHLTSISSDGTVKQWSMKKGLVPTNIMTLKRIANQAQTLGQLQADGVISRTGSGLCFDFPIDDQTQYLAGTEDGIVHKCSVSYNEQVLDNFFGHTAPVYQLRCSPFAAEAFLTCSADWSVKVWSQKRAQPLLSFQSGFDYITDVAWSPFNSTVFGSVSRDGRVEVWDLDKSTLDPMIRFSFANTSLSRIQFARNAQALVTGSTDGSVELFRVYGLEDRSGWSRDEQITSLQDILYADTNAQK